MSGETLYEAPRKYNVSQVRVHDYLYDSAFIVSGARDYARSAFKAAMQSAQMTIQPVYRTMFSEQRKYPRMNVVYHPNCRLPDHMDRSYRAYIQKLNSSSRAPAPQLAGKDRFKYSAVPKIVMAVPSATPDFHPPSPAHSAGGDGPAKPRNRATQSVYRESSAQTIPWQPEGKAADTCEETPEVLYLDKLLWGPGRPYRTGDLPADFHTTEIINKLRHARMWSEVAEKAVFPRWMKRRDAIISDVETKDWIFREAEIDELQEIRLELLHKLQSQQRQRQLNRTSRKLAKLWDSKKQEMERKIDHIRRTRDRELRKLSALHGGGGRSGLVARMRSARGAGSMTFAATDPTSDVHAPLARHGYQARRRHAEIRYDPSLLSLEDHEQIAKPPAWLDQCGQDLTRSFSGHHLPRDPMQLCERETKWSEQFLENMHNDLKKARLGAAVPQSAGPLHVLKPRRLVETPRPSTPEVEAVEDNEEISHQAALVLQRIIRGRAVQTLMYEGRTRAAELTEELKMTHGLQKEDKVRISREESKARDFNALRTEAEQKEDAITALVEELCGGAVSAALDFLEKELRRLKEERRQHAFILIALREKTMREAAEAGRRQREEHRRREHDEMFKQVLGVTQETVDAYLLEVVKEGVELAAEEDAVRRAQAAADKIDREENESLSTAEQNELVAALVQQFLLPHVHKTAARHRIAALQHAKMDAARETIFGLLDDAEIKQQMHCTQCGCPLDELCRCRACPISQRPVETASREDPRWIHARRRPRPEPKSLDERYPTRHEMRCMLNTLIDEAVVESRRHRSEEADVKREWGRRVREGTEVTLDAMAMVDAVFDRAAGASSPPIRGSDYHYYMKRVVEDALERSEPFGTCLCPKELPGESRRRAEQRAMLEDPSCRCEDEAAAKSKVMFGLEPKPSGVSTNLLPSELRALEDMRRCKCDTDATTSPKNDDFAEEATTEMTEATEQSIVAEEEENQ